MSFGRVFDYHPVPYLVYIGHELSWYFTVTALEY